MDYREYENRVADVLAFLAGDSASVERNQMCWGTLSGGYRQIDVLVEGRVGDLANATMIGDCKRWSHTVDVADVGCFIDLAQDVGADVGLLMVSGKVSERAHKRAKNEEGRGIRIDVLDVDDLARWNPPGMLSTTYRFPIQYREVAIRRLRNAGFRVQGSRAPEPTKIEAVIEVSCHYGIRNPGIDTQRGHWDRARAALKEAGVHDPVHVGHGIVVNGGDPRRP